MRKCDLDCACGKHSAELTYSSKHYRVRKLRGGASSHVCETCGSRAGHWSQVHGTDGSDPYEHYKPLCVSCHFAYDGNQAKAAAASVGREWTDEQRAQRSERMRRWNESLTPQQRSANTLKAWESRRTKKVGE